MYNGDTKEFDFTENDDESVNEIIEIRNSEEVETLEDEIINNMSYKEPKEEAQKKKKKNIFKVIKDKWNDLSKKQKIIFIIIGVIILLAIVIALIFLLKKDPVTKNPEEPVVLEADNYRYENGKLFFLDSDGKDIGSYDCENKKETLCYVAYSSNEDNFDVEKNVYEDGTEVLERMRIINDNYVFIYDNASENDGNIIIYNIKENSTSESYELVKQYNKYNLVKDYVVAKTTDGVYTLLLFNENGYEELLEEKYSYLGIITENKSPAELLVAQKNDKWYLIDFEGKEKTKAINYEIKEYNTKYISVINENGEYLLYDYQNKQVTEETYDYINFTFDYVLLVKNQKLTVFDSELSKLHEEPFKLQEDNYIDTNIFNEESGKLIENHYSFSLVMPQESNSIVVYINDGEDIKETLINTLESVVNKNYDNISYFDGKLYIYGDAEKNNVLGVYECSNKNIITSEDSTLDNCFIASNSEFSDNDMNYAEKRIGLLPIFNNRFVFIKDNPELTSAETMNIILYDLASSKKLSTYRAIDAGVFNGKQNVSFVEGTGLLLIAKNTKDYYGILKVNLSEVSSLANVKFGDKFKNIETINDNYLIQKSTDTYYLIDKTGTSISSEFSGKIMGYKNNYVKVKNGNEYSVFDLDGEEISNKKSKYVELYNTVYAAVDANDNINLYKYNDESQTPLCASSYKLGITSNYKEGNSFSVVENGDSYTIEININKDGEAFAKHTCPEINE